MADTTSLAGKRHPKSKSIQPTVTQLRGEIHEFLSYRYFLTGQQWLHILYFRLDDHMCHATESFRFISRFIARFITRLITRLIIRLINHCLRIAFVQSAS